VWFVGVNGFFWGGGGGGGGGLVGGGVWGSIPRPPSQNFIIKKGV